MWSTTENPELARAGNEFSQRADLNDVFVTRASAWRSLLEVLHAHGVHDAVRARVPAAVERLMDRPPLPVSWMPAVAFQFIFRALDDLVDPDTFARMAHDSVVKGPLVRMKPVVEGILRLFGASPEAFLRRTAPMMETQVRGMTFELERFEPGEAVLRVVYDHLENPPDSAFDYWRAVMEINFELCSITVVSRTERIDAVPHNAARLIYAWDIAPSGR